MADAALTSARPPRPDGWLVWAPIVAVLVALVVALLCGLPGVLSFILIPLTVLGAPALAVVLLVVATVFAARRQFRRAGSILIAVALPVLLWSPINRVADYLHLGLTIASAGPEAAKRPFTVYDWSVGLAGGQNTFLVHDLADLVARPAQPARSDGADGGFADNCAGHSERLLGHYYVCRI